MNHAACHHCGLPVRPSRSGREGPLYCCYGCQLASGIVGGGHESPQRAWHILRLAVGALLSMNVMMISLLLYTGGVERSAEGFFRWIMLATALPAMALLTWPFLAGSLRGLRRGQWSLDALIALGSLAAFGVSAANTIRGRGNVYFDTATMLPLLVTFGKLLEASAKASAASLLRSLETLLPATALVVADGGGASETPLADLRPGDRLRVLPGGRIPADGRIVQGRSSIEESAFTGEARPREVNVGEQVIAGTVNGAGCVELLAAQVGPEMLLHRIVESVRQARLAPASTDRLAERMAAWFTPAVLALAVATAAVHLAAGGGGAAALAALSVLVVACPCSVGIATPLATALALARAARGGMLVRGGDVLERAGLLRQVFFDKTGTLTEGAMTVTAIECNDGAIVERELLSRLAALECFSEHWLARAITRHAAAMGVAAAAASDVLALPGRGLSGRVVCDGREELVYAGNAECMREGGLALPAAADAPPPQALPEGAGIRIYVGWAGAIRGRVTLEDPLRPEAAATMAALRQLGIEPVLLSGDAPEAAAAVAARLGIDKTFCRCLPDDKIERVRWAGREQLVGMAGDGVNDAPALAAAGVGFALGGGTDLAAQSGDVVLLADRLDHIPALVGLSRATRAIIVQNLTWCVAYNTVALAAAAIGWLHPLLAAVAMTASSLTVLANSMRVQRLPLQQSRRTGEQVNS